MLLSALELLAALLTLICGVPQALRSLRSTTGVSATSWATLAGVGAIWVLYAWTGGVWPLLVSEAFFALCAFTIAVRASSPQYSLLLLIGTLALLATLHVAGPLAVGVSAVLSSAACRIPQVRKAYTAPDTSGVASLSWILLAAANVLWFFAGLAGAGMVLILGGLLSVLSSLAVVLCARYSPYRSPLHPLA